MKKDTPRMSAQELKEFVLDYCDGVITTDKQINNENLVGMVFMPLLFMDYSELNIDSIGIIYANRRTDDMTNRAINGWPTFMSCRFMHQKDWELVIPAIKKEMKRRENLVVDFQMKLEGVSDGNRESRANPTLPGLQEEGRGRAESDLRGPTAVDGGHEGGADQETDGTVGRQTTEGYSDSPGYPPEE